MAAPQKIIDLVERFERNKDAYTAGQYNETQVRREFIDPFFKELGWDIDNEQGYAEAYKDVVHEDAIRIGGMHKAPDYCMRIGGVRKFFVEAKKPSVNVKDDAAPAFQVRRYAWSAKLPLSIVTDFQELAVYDCRIRPVKTDKSAKARILYFTYADYAEQWDRIVSIFSPEAIRLGSFDAYADSTKTKRGTEEVDIAFLKEIERWRELLARNLALRNPLLTQRELNYAVQVTIDRLIFLRICEDRSIEPYGKLLEETKKDGIYDRLKQHFRDADARYNSGLFHFEQEKDQADAPDTFTLDLAIDDAVLKDILSHLYYPESPYEFSVLPAEILGQVYEQFLGKVIRLTEGHQAKVEEKPEVRKAGGVYYTPAYIVRYIVEHTVGKLLEGKTPKEVAKLTICDPACGSGSFLLGAYQFLLDWHLAYYTGNDPGKWTKQIVRGPAGDWRLTTAERKRILLANIYGVDIDAQAVEVTKLSLLLKVLEGETEQTIGQQMSFLKERVLPNLGNNIKCGNSLIGPDFYAMQQPGLLEDEEQQRLNVFDWERAFPNVFSGKSPGFDAVVGNPPYVRQELISDQKPYYQMRYKVYHGIADLYVYFFERGMQILKNGGQFGIIVANKWMRANYGKPLREWLLDQKILEIADFGDLPVFKGATTYPCIIRLEKGKTSEKFKAIEVTHLKFSNLSEYIHTHSFDVNQLAMLADSWTMIIPSQQKILGKIAEFGIPLGKYIDHKIFYGIKTGLNEAFVLNEEIREKLIKEDPRSAELIKPFLFGREIKRYMDPHATKYLLFTRRGIQIDNFPAVKAHLEQYKDRLIPKPKNWKNDNWKGRKSGPYEWYEIQDTVDYWDEFEKPKIVYAEIATRGQFTLDQGGVYADTTLYTLGSNSKYLLGILNSSLITFFFQHTSSHIRGGYLRWKRQYMNHVPIRTIDFDSPQEKSAHDHLISLVDEMLELNKKLPSIKTPHEQEQMKRQIESIDQQIDQVVFGLYGLSGEEVNIIKNSST